MANTTLSPEVADVLRRSTITENLLILPPGHLPFYPKVKKALEMAGGKWKTNKQAFVFDSDPRQKLGLALSAGVVIDEKKKFQAFFTPSDVADQMALWAEIAGHDVLEPSAGHGALADACLKFGAKSVQCVELNPEFAAILRQKEYSVAEADFLTWPGRKFSRIVMNPPFTKNQDIEHVQRAVELLAPGGILVAIMAPNVDRIGYRKFIARWSHEITEIERGAFKESGTTVATIAIKVRRPDESNSDYPTTVRISDSNK